MMNTLTLDIVSLEAEIFSGQVKSLTVSGSEGELGVIPGHAPLLTQLKPGDVHVIAEDGKEETFYISGGMLEIQPDVVTVLADTAIRASDIDEAAAVAAEEKARQALTDRKSETDYGKAAGELARAIAQVQTLRKARRKTGL